MVGKNSINKLTNYFKSFAQNKKIGIIFDSAVPKKFTKNKK